jgi:hypothetical protein
MKQFRALWVCGLTAWFAASSLWAASDTRVTTSFAKGAELTAAEVKDVLTIAHRAGVTNVAEVYTYFISPSPDRGVGVKETDTITDRQIHCRILFIMRGKWQEESHAAPTNSIQVGDFWLDSVHVQNLTILRVQGREFKISVSGGIPVVQAEAILSEFLKGSYDISPVLEWTKKLMKAKGRYSDLDFQKCKDEFERMDVTKPIHLGYNPKTKKFNISFGAKADTDPTLNLTFLFSFLFEGNKIKLLNGFIAMT